MANTTSLPVNASSHVNCDKMLTDNGVFGNIYEDDAPNDCELYGFDSLSIPAGATIDGIQVINEIEANTLTTKPVYQVYNGAWSSAVDISSTPPKRPTAVITTPTATDYLWGLSWDATTAAAIRVKVDQSTSPSASESHIDYLQVTIHYTAIAIQRPLTINGSLNVNGTLIIK